MKLLTKPIYIRFPVATLLVLLLVLALVITGFVLYRNRVFHNLFFQTLSSNNVRSISIYSAYEKELTPLSQEETDALIPLLRNIRLKEEPYQYYGLIGDQGNDYRIELKNGITFDLNLSGGDPGVYIFGEDAYSIGYRNDPEAAADFENLWNLEAMYRIHTEKYYPAATEK